MVLHPKHPFEQRGNPRRSPDIAAEAEGLGSAREQRPNLALLVVS
jgi:hypothetical protein